MAELTQSDPRQRLLDAAGRLFYEQSYNGTGINQIIAEAQVAKASFYHHFKSKEDLLVAYLERAHDDAMRGLREHTSAGKTPARRVLGVFGFFKDCLESKTFCGCPFLNACGEFPRGDARAHEVIRWHQESVKAHFHELVAALGRERKWAQQRVDQLAAELYIIVEGGLAAGQLERHSGPMATARELAAARLELDRS